MEWKPIDTAPKDGTKILMFDGETMQIVDWDKLDYWGTSDCGSGWRDEWYPTHWMPLPEAPNAEVSGAGTASAGLPGHTAGDNTE